MEYQETIGFAKLLATYPASLLSWILKNFVLTLLGRNQHFLTASPVNLSGKVQRNLIQ